jgi:molybdate transport system substrate-binding protein
MVFCPYAGELTYNAPMLRPAFTSPAPSPALRRLRRALLFLTVALGCALVVKPQAGAHEPLRVAVAANFRVAAEQLGERFEADTGVSVVVSSASTGVLAAQLRHGAPLDLLLAADQARPQALVDDAIALGPTQCYALGSLVLLGSDSINAALADVNKSIAIANPRSAPYGAAALAVLNRDGFAGPDDRRVVMGSNVQQAFQFYDSGAADLALVARSLSPQSGLPTPRDWHPRIEQHAIINAATDQLETAQRFMAFILSSSARPILQSFGYESCQ